MAVPSKEAFLEAINFTPISLVERKVESSHGLRQPEQLKAFIVDCLKELTYKGEAFEALSVAKWYYGQPIVLAALKKLYGKRKTKHPNDDEVADSWVTHFLSALTPRPIQRYSDYEKKYGTEKALVTMERINSPEELERYFVRRLNSWLEREQRGWTRSALNALSDYFYTDRWRLMLTEYQNREKELTEAKAAIDCLKRLAHYEIEPINKGMFNRTFRSLEEEINLQLSSSIKDLYPIRRNDDTARERLLILDFMKANLEFFGARKTDAIYDLMQIEGIQTSYDMRNLERIVADHVGKNKAYRQKVRAIQAESAG